MPPMHSLCSTCCFKATVPCLGCTKVTLVLLMATWLDVGHQPATETQPVADTHAAALAHVAPWW